MTALPNGNNMLHIIEDHSYLNNRLPEVSEANVGA